MPGIELILATITAVTTAGGALAAYGLFKSQSSEAKAKAEAESIRHRYGQALKEIEGRQMEEDLFCQELEGMGVGSAQSQKIEFRNRVAITGAPRPGWKPARTKEELEWVEGAPHRSPDERAHPTVKPVGPLQYVVARHLDKFLSGDENARIRPLPAPMIDDNEPRDAISHPATARPAISRPAAPSAGPDID